MVMEESLKVCLLRGKDLSDNEMVRLKECLHEKTLQQLHVLAKSVTVRLNRSSCKADIVELLIGMTCTGATKDESLNEEKDLVGISYITDEVKSVLQHFQASKNAAKS